MKSILFLALMSFAVMSCSDNTTGNSKTGTGSSDITQPNPDLNAADTTAVPGKGTDKIPSRTGTTGQGNTTVTGSATGSPTGTGKKDTTR